MTEFLRGVEADCILRGSRPTAPSALGAVARCLHELKRPDLAYRSIHVTGNEWKDDGQPHDRCADTGDRIDGGRLYEPACHEFRERIMINGEPIGEDELVDACNHVKAFLDVHGLQLVPFRILTGGGLFSRSGRPKWTMR